MGNTLTVERARELLDYDPVTGEMTWRVARRGCRAGGRVGSLNKDGYLRVCVDRRYYYVQRLAWFLVRGEWPSATVDHKNGNRADNRWANLRDVSTLVNNQNLQGAPKTSLTGVIGAHLRAGTGRFVAKIRAHGKQIHLGTFDTAEEAQAVYLAAKRARHPGCTL